MVKRSLRDSKVPKSRRGRKTMNRYKVSRGRSKVLRKRLKVSKNIKNNKTKRNKTKRNKTKRNKTRQKQKGGAGASIKPTDGLWVTPPGEPAREITKGTLLRKTRTGMIDKYIIYHSLAPGKNNRLDSPAVINAYLVDENGKIGEHAVLPTSDWNPAENKSVSVEDYIGKYRRGVYIGSDSGYIDKEDMSNRMKSNYEKVMRREAEQDSQSNPTNRA